MAVVINEFEVVPGESSQSKQNASPAQSQTESASAPHPQEIEQMIEQEHERCERVWAH
jgi:hypothetical protein